MLTLPSSVRIYVAAEPVDLRRGFDGLAAATRSLMGADPMNGHVFVFLNRRRNRIKLLVWDRTGYLLVYKRLERGTFQIPTEPEAGRRQAEWVEHEEEKEVDENKAARGRSRRAGEGKLHPTVSPGTLWTPSTTVSHHGLTNSPQTKKSMQMSG